MWTYLIANYDNEKQTAVFILGHVSAAYMCSERSQKRNKMKVVVWGLQTDQNRDSLQTNLSQKSRLSEGNPN